MAKKVSEQNAPKVDAAPEVKIEAENKAEQEALAKAAEAAPENDPENKESVSEGDGNSDGAGAPAEEAAHEEAAHEEEAPAAEAAPAEAAPAEEKKPAEDKKPRGKKPEIPPEVTAKAAPVKKVKVVCITDVDSNINGERYIYPAKKIAEVPADVAQILVHGGKAYRM